MTEAAFLTTVFTAKARATPSDVGRDLSRAVTEDEVDPWICTTVETG